MAQGDRPDSPAGVIRSLFQADPFPCSVASLGRTDLFKALEPLAYARNPMATQNLIRAPGKRRISASPQPLTASIQPRSRITGYTQAIDTPAHSLYTRHSQPHFTYGSMTISIASIKPRKSIKCRAYHDGSPSALSFLRGGLHCVSETLGDGCGEPAG